MEKKTENIFKGKVVLKPWGQEYLCYENKIVAIWVLHINFRQSTSMHCHPMKDTGLVVIKGKAKLSFLNNKINLRPLSKIHIFKRRFHSTKATSKNGCVILEIETPNDKKNLLRVADKYGRKNTGYEKPKNFIKASSQQLNLNTSTATNKPLFKTFFGKKIARAACELNLIRKYSSKNCIFIITKGGLIRGKQKIIVPSDVVDGNSLKKLLKFSKFKKGTQAVIVKK